MDYMTEPRVEIAIFEDHPMMREALAHNIVLHLPDAIISYKGSSIIDFFKYLSLNDHPLAIDNYVRREFIGPAIAWSAIK